MLVKKSVSGDGTIIYYRAIASDIFMDDSESTTLDSKIFDMDRAISQNTANIAVNTIAINNKLPLSGGTITGSLTVTDTITANSFHGSLKGNADSATKLKTPITITVGECAKQFDGSKDIEFKLSEIIGSTIELDSIKIGNGLLKWDDTLKRLIVEYADIE